MNKNSNIHKLDKDKNVIGIEQFIINYLNDGNYVTCFDLTHKDLKKFSSPYVITIPFDLLESYIDYIYSGIVIIVRDVLGHIAPYINPSDLKIVNELKKIEQGSLKKEELSKFTLDLNRINSVEYLLEDLKNYQKERKDKNGKKY